MLKFCILLTFSTTAVKNKEKNVIQMTLILPFALCFSEVFKWGV